MNNPPKNLNELILRMEQMKKNMKSYRHNNAMIDHISITFVEAAELFKEYNEGRTGTEYMRWYVDFRNGRLE